MRGPVDRLFVVLAMESSQKQGTVYPRVWPLVITDDVAEARKVYFDPPNADRKHAVEMLMIWATGGKQSVGLRVLNYNWTSAEPFPGLMYWAHAECAWCIHEEVARAARAISCQRECRDNPANVVNLADDASQEAQRLSE